MINAAKLIVPGLPGGAEASSVLLSDKVGVGLQASELKEDNFDITLLSRLGELTDVETLELSDILLAEQLVLPEGKELPLLPEGKALPVLPDAEVLLLLPQAGSEPEQLAAPDLSMAKESDAIIAGPSPFLPIQIVQERPAEKKTGTAVTPFQSQTQTTTPTNSNDLADMLFLAANTRTVMKTDSTAETFNLIPPDPHSSERTTEMPAIAGSGVSPKLNLSGPINQTTGMLRLSIDVPVQQAKWSENLAGRVAWMVMNNQPSAQISLNPAELGPIEVKVSLQNDQASVNFYAHNTSVRDAIQEAFPRLRDMLNEHGLNLGQSSVSDQSFSQRQGYSELARQEPSRYPFTSEGDPVQISVNEIIKIKLGLVDHFV